MKCGVQNFQYRYGYNSRFMNTLNRCGSHRLEDNRWCCNRVGKKSAGCDHFDHVFSICVCLNGTTNIYGCVNAEMYQGIPRRWQLGESNRRELGKVLSK